MNMDVKRKEITLDENFSHGYGPESGPLFRLRKACPD